MPCRHLLERADQRTPHFVGRRKRRRLPVIVNFENVVSWIGSRFYAVVGVFHGSMNDYRSYLTNMIMYRHSVTLAMRPLLTPQVCSQTLPVTESQQIALNEPKWMEAKGRPHRQLTKVDLSESTAISNCL